MTDQNLREELDRDPFTPLRLHLVSGKTVDVLRPGVGWTLSDRLLVFRNPTVAGSSAEGYDVIAYANIERVEQLRAGEARTPKKKRA